MNPETDTSTPSHPESGLKLPCQAGSPFQAALIVGSDGFITVAIAKEGKGYVKAFPGHMEALETFVDGFLTWAEESGLITSQEAPEVS